MDEPFSALDPLIRTEMQDLLLELQSELGKTIIFVTHDPDEAVRLGDNIAILKDGELIQHGAPMQILTSPKTITSAPSSRMLTVVAWSRWEQLQMAKQRRVMAQTLLRRHHWPKRPAF